jgi:hypothetical protein
MFLAVMILSSISCTRTFFNTIAAKFLQDAKYDTWFPEEKDEDAPDDPGEPSDPGASGVYGSAGDETASTEQTEQDTSSGYGDLKPVGFVNYGEFDATVRAYSYIPLGETNPVPPPGASTVSSANSGSGTWPNTSRFISVPMGTYSWCIDWEEGDLDEDGQIDYFHYIEEGPTLLDENDSDDLDHAEEVAISAPPATAPVFAGKCQVLDNSCVGQPQETRIYSSPGWVMGTDYQPKVTAPANYFDYPPPEGITLTNGGGSGFQQAIILVGGQYLEATTSNSYSAMGVQPHGESTIGWARVLFDGVEVWRGDTSSYWHDAEAYVHAVYIEVRCYPPGTHTLRIEALGIAGSGGGQTVPIAFFGFRP